MVVSEFNVPISMDIIITLLIIGACIKHLSIFEKISNRLIPVVLLIASIVITVFKMYPIGRDNVLEVVIVSLASSIIAVGIHSSGKNIFANGKFVELFMKNFYNGIDIPLDDVEIKNIDEEEKVNEDAQEEEEIEENNEE